MADFRLSELEVKDMKLGTKQVSAVYFRDETVWPQASSYFTTIAKTAGTIQFSGTTTGNTLQYSKNNGAWSNASDNITVDVANGDEVRWKGNMVATTSGVGRFSGGTANFDLDGNIMSLLYGDDFDGQTVLDTTYTFYRLFAGTKVMDSSKLKLPATTLTQSCYNSMFSGCTSLTTAPELPATTLANLCYSYMFYNCTSLTTVHKLPATTLATNCYSNMFNNCSGLTSVPSDMLPATTLTGNCYNSMFRYCSSLTTVPNLPATTLASGCYNSMFHNCFSLTAVPSDLLPATTLADNCYNTMFRGCSGLTKSPELPATTLVTSCYSYMFYGCSSLKEITALFTTTPTTTYTNNFVGNVSSTGIFVKNPDATWTTTGTRAVPTGWTIPIAWLYLSDGDMKYITVPSNTATASTTITSAMTSAQTSTSFSVSKVLVTNLCNGLEDNAFNPYVGAGTPYYTTTEYDLMHSKIVWVGDGCFCTTNCPSLEFPDTLTFVGGGGLASKNLRELKFHSTTQPIMTSDWSNPPLVLDIQDGENYIRSGGVVKYPSGVDYGAWTYYTGLYGWTSQTI